jgi:drug/metabolite transporter (DMT)-like permease
MTVLCMLWGFQQVTIKVAAPDVSLVMQAGIRSIIATALLLVWARARGIPLFDRDRTLAAGLGAGVLFATEFVFIYAGLAYTAASRMIVFIYTTPCWTALMLPFFVPVERLSARQWPGAARLRRDRRGVREGFVVGGGTFVGDLFRVIAAFL